MCKFEMPRVMTMHPYLVRNIVVHSQNNNLSRDVSYPRIVEDFGVVEWDAAGHWRDEQQTNAETEY